jgi:hypothetical protein
MAPRLNLFNLCCDKSEANFVAVSILLPANRVARWHIFKTKIPIFGQFWRVLQWKVLVYLHIMYMSIWSILWLFGVSFTPLGMLYQQNLATLPAKPTYVYVRIYGITYEVIEVM